MNGLIALLGSGEYLSVMDDVDHYLLANCGADGRKPRVVCLPTAAGQEGEKSIFRWSKMGMEHFTRLGADVQALPVIDAEVSQRSESCVGCGRCGSYLFLWRQSKLFISHHER